MLKHYTQKGVGVEILASAGPRPIGSLYVMIEKEDNMPIESLGDGSFQGLFLEDKGGRVRISELGTSGLFIKPRINKGDNLLSINGHPISCTNDCEMALKKASRGLIPILTYNLFRRVRSCVQAKSIREKSLHQVIAKEGQGRQEQENRHNSSRCVGDLSDFETTSKRESEKKPDTRQIKELYTLGAEVSLIKKCAIFSLYCIPLPFTPISSN